jgi:hypothetical protein
MTDQKKPELMSHCRQCGGERHHVVIAEETRSWSDHDSPIDGSDTWSILECGGCHTVTFLHSHWFSENFEVAENGPQAIVHRDLYPPAPARKMPDWARVDAFLSIPIDNLWIIRLYNDIYAAAGMKSYALAAMGARAIVDFVVTSKAGGNDSDKFLDKLNRMFAQNLITKTQVDVINAAFDAGSAAAHRGYVPIEQDVYTLIGITETLLEQIYIIPAAHNKQAASAAALKLRTPPRQRRKKGP